MRTLEVVRAGPRTTIQDAGRRHLGHLGVPAAGPVDRASMRAANLAVGNPADAAVIESTLGGDELLAHDDVLIAVRGASAVIAVDGLEHDAPLVELRRGQRLRISRAATGAYVYVAVAGGIAVEPVLGSRATDTLSRLGPPQLTTGDLLPVAVPAPPTPAETERLPHAHSDVRIVPGPHVDLLPEPTLAALLGAEWTVSPAADRTALRLRGPVVDPGIGGIDSEGLVPGAIQLPPNGQPVVFLANHPVTGGYPVAAVVIHDCLGTVAQRRPGDGLRLVLAR